MTRVLCASCGIDEEEYILSDGTVFPCPGAVSGQHIFSHEHERRGPRGRDDSPVPKHPPSVEH